MPKMTPEERAAAKAVRDAARAAERVRRAEERLALKAQAKADRIAAAEGPRIPLPALVIRNGTDLPVVRSCTLRGAWDLAVAPNLGALCLDVETSGYWIGHTHYELRTVQLGGADTAVVLDPADPAQKQFASLSLEAARKLHAHSATADVVPCVEAGIIGWDAAWDRMEDSVLRVKLTDPKLSGSDANALKELARDLLGPRAVAPAAEKAKDALFRAMGCLKDTKVTTEPERSGWAQVAKDCEVMIRYAGSDILDLAAVLRALPPLPVDDRVLQRERRFQKRCALVAWKGFGLDLDHIQVKIAEHDKTQAGYQAIVSALTNGAIENPSSSKVVLQVLTELGYELKLDRQTKKISAGKDSLKPIAARGDVLAAAILGFRHDVTTNGLLLRPLENLCTHGDGRMRPTVFTISADTGRASCVRPNGQQFSRRGGVRKSVVADPGYLGISCDFQGCEIRVAAGLSGDAALLEAETSLRCHLCGEDPCGCGGQHTGLHWFAAHTAFGEGATYEDRYKSKSVIFTRLFGGKPETAADQVGKPVEFAHKVFQAFAQIAPGFTAWDAWLRKCYYEGMLVWRDYEAGNHCAQPLPGGKRGVYRTYNGRQIYINAPHAFGNYCLAPGTPVLRSDLHHVPASEVRPGDRLVAFDEDAGSSTQLGNKYRYMRTAVVEATGVVRKPSVRVYTSDGKSTVCSTDHQWLVRKEKEPHRGPRVDWGYAQDLQPGDMLLSLGTWEQDRSYEAGYAAGLLDGEGCLSARGLGHKQTGLVFSQLPGRVMDEFCEVMGVLGLPGAYRKRPPGSTTNTDSVQVTSIRNILRVLGTLQPQRFQDKFEGIYEGAALSGGLTETVRVLAVEPVGVRELSFIQTSTRTLVANGYLSHNSIQGTARELLVDGVEKWEQTRWGDIPLLPIHDELFGFVKEDEAHVAVKEMAKCMETDVLSSPGFRVHIGADPSEPFAFWPDSS